MTDLSTRLAPAASRLRTVFRRHPRAVAATVVVGLGGFAAAAFGTAPLTAGLNDPALVTPRWVSQPVATDGIAVQIEALADRTLDLYRGDTTRPSDSVTSLLHRLSVDDRAASAFIRNDPTARRLLTGRAGKQVQVRTSANGELIELVARFGADRPELMASHFTRLTVAREHGAAAFTSHLELAPMDRQVRVGGGTVRNSLFAATDDAHLPDPIAGQLTDIFAGQIDFHHQLRRGDTFRVVYEALTADGEPCGWLPESQSSGRVLAAEFVNAGKLHTAIWFASPAPGAKGGYVDANSKGAYFDAQGQSTRRAFLASPVAFSRITSGFSMRFHPIMQLWRHHDGVDFGAPSGTPVHAVGDAAVTFAGWQNGYGNVVILQHSGARDTVYAHLSRIDVRKGQHVTQAAVIGAVGATGWATGPHLHFEFKLNGRQLDPLSVARAADTQTVADASRPQFARLARAMVDRLQVATTGVGGDAYGE